jgi:hypothetical protein
MEDAYAKNEDDAASDRILEERRRSIMWNRKLPSSTLTSGQTRARRSFLSITSFGRLSKAMRMSSVRPLTATGTPSLVRSLSLTTKLKGPNDSTALVCAARIMTLSSANPPLPFKEETRTQWNGAIDPSFSRRRDKVAAASKR